MPTYVYRCIECDHRFERVLPITADGDTDCPQCGSPARRIPQPAGVIYRGSGFYTTDYARPKKSEE